MYVCAELRPLGAAEIAFRRRALRDAIICIGWFKLLSVLFYVLLVMLTDSNSEGEVSNIIKLMLLVAIPLQILNAVFLFMGVLEKKIYALKLGLFLLLLIAAYNSVVGMVGCIYFIRTGHLTLHFFIAVIFGILTFSIFTVMCHDVIVIHTFKTIIQAQMQMNAAANATPSASSTATTVTSV